MVQRRVRYKKIFAGGRGMFNRGLEMFQKRGLDKKGVEKKTEGGLRPSKKLFPLNIM